MDNKLDILSESLDEKILLLKQIAECSERQAKTFATDTEDADLDAFDREFDVKDKLIEEIARLDEGFDTLYEGVARELQEHKDRYASKIKELQKKITEVTELSVSIQAQEARNKELVQEYFTRSRNGIRQNRQSSKAAFDYYKSMSGMAYSTSRILDNKQ